MTSPETARRNGSLYVAALLDAVRARGFQPETVAMDGGYDHARLMPSAPSGAAPRSSRSARASPSATLRIPRSSDRWRSLYRRRSAVEREFGRLKHDYGLAFLRVRGIERVRLHADLIMLARLSSALARGRAEPLAA